MIHDRNEGFADKKKLSGETDDKKRIVSFRPIHMHDKHGPAEIFPSTLSHKKWAWPEAVLYN